MPALSIPFRSRTKEPPTQTEDHASHPPDPPPPPQPVDFAAHGPTPRSNDTAPADRPVASDDATGPEGQAQVIISAERPGVPPEALGHAPQNTANAAVLLSSDAMPVSGLPSGVKSLETVLTSGATGLGPEGTATFRALQSGASPVGSGSSQPKGSEALVAPAKGIAPEAIVNTTDETSTNPIQRLLRKTPSKIDEDDKQTGSSLVSAISQMMPENVLGVNLASLGLPRSVTDAPTHAITGSDGTESDHESGSDLKDGTLAKLPVKLQDSGAPPAGHSKEPGGETSEREEMPDGLRDIAAATKEEDDHFHRLFGDVPSNDKLVASYSCALQRQILLQGRIYLSQHHLAFRANILGVETTLIVPLSEVVALEKRYIALVIPNAIEIATAHARHTFASFLHRDEVFDLMVRVWRFTHPQSSVPPLDSKRVKIADQHTVDDAASGHSDDNEPADLPAASRATTNEKDAESFMSVETTDTQGQKVHKKRKLRKLIAHTLSSVNHGSSFMHHDTDGAEGNGDDGGEAAAGSGHPATKCACSGDDGHFKEVALDGKFNGTPDKIFQLIWASGWMTKFFAETEKLTEIQIGDWEPSFDKEGAKRELSYVKPLNASMGPKSTKCLLNDTQTHIDPGKSWSTLTVTRTPDVPAGTSFEVRTKTCLTHSGTGGTRVFVTTEVHWHSTQRFLKGIIERSALEGQVTYHRDLQTEMRKHIKEHSDEFGGSGVDEEEEAAVASPSAIGSATEGPRGMLSSLGLPSDVATLGLLVLVILLLVSNAFSLVRLHRAKKLVHGDLQVNLESVNRAIAELEQRMDAIKYRASRLADAA